MKKITVFLLALVLLLTQALPAFAAETGTCGENITWTYENGTLSITGSGPMDDFPEGAPWAQFKDSITTVVISGGVTYIGAGSFRDHDALTQLDVGSYLEEIGQDAFNGCDGLTSVTLPHTFKVFHERSFQGCSNLKEFHCAGRFPQFKLNCMWETRAIIYYPAAYPWGINYIKQLTEAFHGRIKFLASDGTDPLKPEETTAPTTEPTTAPTTEPTTVPTTEATTAPTETTAPPAESTARPTAAPTAPPTTFPTSGNPEPGKVDSSTTTLLIALGIVALLSASVAVALAVYQANERKRRARRRRTPGRR